MMDAGLEASSPWSNPSPRSIAGFDQECRNVVERGLTLVVISLNYLWIFEWPVYIGLLIALKLAG